MPWLQLKSHGFARFLGSVTGPQVVLVALWGGGSKMTQKNRIIEGKN